MPRRAVGRQLSAISLCTRFAGDPVGGCGPSSASHILSVDFRRSKSGDRIQAESNGALTVDDLLHSSVGTKPDVNVIATRDAHKINVLVWNYRDDASPVASAEVHLRIEGLSQDASKVKLEHWRVDHDHSNAYTAWQNMGSPKEPTPQQMADLLQAGNLQTIGNPETVTINNGAANVKINLPRQGVALLVLTW